MGNYTHANFANSAIAGGAGGAGTNLQIADTSLLLSAGTGTLFGSPSSSAPSMILIGTIGGANELCKVTGVATDTLTIVRAQEGTTAQVWAPTTSVQGVETAAMQGHILYDDGGNITTNGSGKLTAGAGLVATTGGVTATAGGVTVNGGGITVMSGTTSLDNGAITTDGTGYVTTKAGYKLTTTEGGAHTWLAFVRTAGIGNDNALSIYDSTSGVTALSLDTAGNGALAGTLSVTAPTILVTGHQETGMWSCEANSTGTGQKFGSGMAFKCVMANIPSSLTFTTNSSALMGGGTPLVSYRTLYGFHALLTSTGAGDMFWTGTFVTVGNCILWVDEDKRTFDHHCDSKRKDGSECGCVRRGLSLDTDLIATPLASAAAPGYDLHTSPCPQCGSEEHFYTEFTAEDEAGAKVDAEPQTQAAILAAQPYLIRRAQIAKGLAVL